MPSRRASLAFAAARPDYETGLFEIADQTPGTGPEGGLQVQYELPLAPVDPARG